MSFGKNRAPHQLRKTVALISDFKAKQDHSFAVASTRTRFELIASFLFIVSLAAWGFLYVSTGGDGQSDAAFEHLLLTVMMCSAVAATYRWILFRVARTFRFYAFLFALIRQPVGFWAVCISLFAVIALLAWVVLDSMHRHAGM